ncbi:MAG: hypothetical protein KDB80_03845 [Planctomycetes bacterium]|nr:hypothetical protein [Planctomycetota bacterium]
MLLATILTSLSFATTAAPQEPTRVMRTVPVGDLAGFELPFHRTPFGSLLRVEDEGVELIDHDVAERGIAGDYLVELVRTSVERMDPEAVDELVVAVVDSRLALSGPPAAVDRAVAVIRALDASVGRPIIIEASLVEFRTGFGPLDVRLDRDALARALDGKRTRWNSRSVTRSGRATVLSQAKFTQFVYDCDVEVAQDQSISDPQVRTMFEGIHLEVEPHAIPDSEDLVLFGHAVLGDRCGDIETRSTGIDAMTALDVPRVANNQLEFSGRIPNGGALVACFDGAEDSGSRFALIVSASQPREDRQVPGMRAFPVSALTSRSLVSSVRARGVRFDHEAHSVFPLRVGEPGGAMGVDTVYEILSHVLEPQLDEGQVDILMVAGWALTFGRDDVIETTREALVAMHDQWIRSAACDLWAWVDDLDGGAEAAFDGRPDANPNLPAMLHHVRLPVILGRPHFVVHGVESTVVHDVGVEIAQEASAVNPIVTSTFGGLFASLVVQDGIDALSVQCDVDLSQLLRTRRHAAETRHGGDLHLPSTERLRYVHAGPIETGKVLEFGDGGSITDGARRFRVRQAMRVERR